MLVFLWLRIKFYFQQPFPGNRCLLLHDICIVRLNNHISLACKFLLFFIHISILTGIKYDRLNITSQHSLSDIRWKLPITFYICYHLKAILAWPFLLISVRHVSCDIIITSKYLNIFFIHLSMFHYILISHFGVIVFFDVIIIFGFFILKENLLLLQTLLQ